MKYSLSNFKPVLVLSIVVIALFLFPNFVKSSYALHMMILIFLSVSMGESWNILGGYAGQYSIGHAAYFGIGAYVTTLLMQDLNIPPWFGLWGGAIVALLVALVIGSICLRLLGPYFVLASISVAEIIRLLVSICKPMNAAEGIIVPTLPTLSIGGFAITDFATKVPFYYIGLTLALITIAITYSIQHSRIGYFLQAIRDDQNAAYSLGINPALHKNIALCISAVLTSLAGSFYAVYVGFIDPPGVFGIDTSTQILLICIIGGTGTIYGPVIGSLVLVPLSEALRSNLIAKAIFMTGIVSERSNVGIFLKTNLSHAHALIYGILIVVVILFMPDGVLGFMKKAVSNRRL
jgi:branched-chain amino acid transport system permease protein